MTPPPTERPKLNSQTASLTPEQIVLATKLLEPLHCNPPKPLPEIDPLTVLAQQELLELTT